MILIRFFSYILSFTFCLMDLGYCNESSTILSYPYILPHTQIPNERRQYKEENLNNPENSDEVVADQETHEGHDSMEDIFSYDQGDRFNDIETPTSE